MSNRKINYNRPVPSSNTVKKHQNFNDVLNQVATVPSPFFKSIGFWGAIGSSVIALTLLTNYFYNSVKEKNAYEANPTLSIQTNQLPEDTKCITPINDQADHEFESFVIQPGKENTLYVEGGAVIVIPANAFLTGTDDEIMINARVFRDKSEAFVAGVPMDYGRQNAFESAGMIEIRGEQNGKEVQLKSDKQIEVTLGLHKSPDGFDFYSLDDESGKWSTYQADMKSTDVSEANKNLQLLRVDLDQGLAKEKAIANEVERLITPSKSQFHLAENKSQVFELKFNKQEFPELKSFERLQFEAKCSSLKYSEILMKTWSDVALQQGVNGEYEAEFSNQRGDKTSVEVVPVVTGDQAEVAFEKYKSEVEKIEKEKAIKEQELEKIELQNQARKDRIAMIKKDQEQKDLNYLNNRSEAFNQEFLEKQNILNELYAASATFRTNQWGLFNCDKPVKYPQAPSAPYVFASINNRVKAREIHVFDLDKDVQYKYGTYDHPLATVGFNNNKTVVIVRDTDGNMGYARIDSKKDVQYGNITLTPISAKEANLEFFKTLLDEDEERVRA